MRILRPILMPSPSLAKWAMEPPAPLVCAGAGRTLGAAGCVCAVCRMENALSPFAAIRRRSPLTIRADELALARCAATAPLRTSARASKQLESDCAGCAQARHLSASVTHLAQCAGASGRADESAGERVCTARVSGRTHTGAAAAS